LNASRYVRLVLSWWKNRDGNVTELKRKNLHFYKIDLEKFVVKFNMALGRRRKWGGEKGENGRIG